jgi:CheY-like chemotaxis protein
MAIIESTPPARLCIGRLLMRYKNYRIFEAHSGPEGLDLVRQWQPGLIVCDLTLPGMDGFSIVEALKADERTHTIPIVIVSAKNLTNEEWERLRRHTQSVWQKGNFGAQELVSHVVPCSATRSNRAKPLRPAQRQLANELPKYLATSNVRVSW